MEPPASAQELAELKALGNHIRFFKNGVDQGVAYKDLPGGQSVSEAPCPWVAKPGVLGSQVHRAGPVLAYLRRSSVHAVLDNVQGATIRDELTCVECRIHRSRKA